MNLHEESTIEGAMKLCGIRKNRLKEIEAEMVGLWLIVRIVIQHGGRIATFDDGFEYRDDGIRLIIPPSMRRLFRSAQGKLAQKQKEKLRKMLARRKKDEAKHGKIISRQFQAEYDSKTGKLVKSRKVIRDKSTIKKSAKR